LIREIEVVSRHRHLIGRRANVEKGCADLVLDLPAEIGEFILALSTFSDDRMAALVFDQFTLILDIAATDSVATVGFNSADYDAGFAAIVTRGATEPLRSWARYSITIDPW
jgi:hypothetical protein